MGWSIKMMRHYIVTLFILLHMQGIVHLCQPPCLYAENGISVFRLDISKNDSTKYDKHEIIKKTDGTIMAIEIDYENDNIFWSDGHHYLINKTRLDGSNETVLHNVAIGLASSMSVDASSGTLYWLDFLTQHIEMSSSHGEFRNVLLKFSGKDTTIAFIVEPRNGYLFWSILGDHSRIERSNLAGGNRTVIAREKDIHFPTAFVIDYQNNRLMWLEHWLGKIMSVKIDGSDIRMEHELKHNYFGIRRRPYFYGLSYLSATKTFYVTEFVTNGLYAVYLDAANETVVKMIYKERNEGALVAGMKIHEEFSLNILNPCKNTSCNQLCLRLSNTEYTCKCTVGYVLQTDGISCENANAKLEVLFADSEKQRLYHIKTFGNQSGITLNEVPVPTNHTHFYPEALTFDQRLQYIYWTDLKVSKTFRIKKDGSGFEHVNVTHNSGRASRGLAIASKSQVLFWFSGNTLKMSSVSGNFEKTILTSDVYNPRDIVVHEGKGLLFFADQAQRRIVRIHLSSGKTDYFRITREFAQRRGGYTYYYTKATGLAIDYAEDRLYFCDDQSKTLESVKLDFSHHKVVFHETYYINGNFIVQPERSEVVQPFSIAIWKDEVFWTDLYHEAIFRANKRTGTHIEYVTGGLKSPKDIFVHGNYLSEDKKILYKISYHKKDADSSMCYKDDDGCKGKNDELEDPSTCPEGYKQSNFSSYCGKCSDTIGLRFVCPCINWETCAQRHETDVQGCLPSSPYMFFKIRECIQVIKPGYCPYNVSCSSNSTDDATCFSDNDCSQNKKCCKANCGREKCVDSLKQSDHPCLNNNGGCSHFCMALSENYYCDCPDGMQINKTNQLKCQEIPPPTCPAPCLYAANESMLFRIPLNSTSGLTLTENGEPQKVFPTFGFISSVEVDPVNQRLYWADIVHQTLNSSDLDGKDVSTLFSRNIGLIKSISVDSSSKLIYWVDGLLNTVEVASTEGMFRKVLYHYNYGDYIVAIVVDAVNGYLFLSVWGDTPRIERANLDGSNKMMFLDTDIHFPSDLSIDSKNGRLYWFDLVKNRIESISLNGTDRKTEIHVSETDLKPNYVAYSHTMKTAYFWHHQKHLMNSIFALNQTKSATSIYSQRMYFSYILHSTVAEVSLHEDINLNVAAPCLNAENKCSQLCLKINDLESTCACATGFEVDPTNNANCLPVESDYQVLVGNSQSNGFDLLNFYSNQSGLTVTNVMFENKTSATDIDYDRVTGNIFWIDSKSQRILRSSLKDLKPETIVEKVNADDMFVDEISNLLALKVGDYVYLHTLEGKSPIKLPIQLPTRHFLSIPVPYNNNPVFLLFNGMLYFSLPYGYGSITRLDLFTFEKKMIRGTSGNNIHINTMVACNIKRKIYYLDSMSRTLQSFDLDLTNRKIIKRVNMQMPLSMDIYNERIYWTDSAALFSIDISGSENPQVLSNGLKGYKLPFKILTNETRYTEYDTIYRFSTIKENNCFRSCATIKIAINDPEECPSGYEQQGDVKFTCRNCTDKVDGRYVCPCRDKQTCAQRVSNEINGCMSKETPNLIFKTRECRKTIKPGFCPYNESANDCEKLDSCVSDNNCPENEKCCLSGCATKKCQKPNLVLDNPCYKNTCSHLCVVKDTGYKCLCPENMKLDTSNTRCINKTEEDSVCSIQPIVAACKTDRNNHYFFNTTSHQCEQIVYPICAGKENNFESKGDCMKQCQGTKDICSFEKDHGPCQSFAPITKWYFDDDKKKCSTFSYGGCPGNKNNFESEKQCDAVCSGVCPVNDLIGPCVVNPEKTCQEDSDCDGRMLCCSVGCGKECIMPVSPVVKTTQRPSPTTPESICLLPKDSGPCEAATDKWFFNSQSNQCEQFIYGGCQGNENRFNTKTDCQQKCQVRFTTLPPTYTSPTTSRTKDICSFEKDHGPCQSFAPITKWYFDDDMKKCSTFSYGGCPGNKNNFESEKQCNAVCSGVCPVNDLIGPCVVNPEKTCQEDSDCDGRMLCCSVGCGKECVMPVSPVVKTTQRPSPTTPENVCQLEKEPGPCRSSYQRWFYNAEKGQCETFIYGGCQGNANNFETKEKCDAKCQGICLLPKDSGPCEAATDKWFFNSRSNQCEQFIYGGCQGNENRFNTKTDCQKKCQVRFTTLPPTYTSPTTSSHSTSQTTQTFSSPTTVSSVNVTTTSSPTTTTTTSTLATTTTTTSTMATTTGTLATTTTATTSTIATTSKATTTPITTTVTTIEETSPSTTTASETSTVAMTTTPLPLTTLSSSSVPSISTTGSTICTSATSSEGCVCPDNTGGEDCSLRGEDESITVELKVNDGEKKVSKAEVQAELAKALNDGCRQIDCTTKSVAVKRRKRRATGDNLEIRPEDVHIISFKQDGKSVFVVLFARLKDNRLISRDSLMKIFDSFPKSFGKSIGLEYVGYTNVQAENIKDKDKKSKLPIVLGVIGVILLICVAAIFLWKKKGLCKKPLTGPVMKWSNNNENYNNLDAQAQDNTPAVEGFVNPVYATNELGDQALGAQAQPIPVDNVQPIEKKEHVDISDYVQPKDEKIPISDFIEADLSKSIPGVDNPYFPTDPYSVLAGIKPPEYSSRPNTAQVGRYELPPYMSRVDIRQDEVSGDDLQKEILSALDASYAKDKQNADKKPDSTDNRTYSTVSLKDSGNFDTPFLPSEEVPNARSVSSVSLRDSGRFDTPFLPGDDIVPPAINSSVASVRSITVGEHAPEETPGRPSTVIEVQNSNTDC